LRIANDDFAGSSLDAWWVPLQANLLTSGWTVGNGYLQASVDSAVHTYNNEIGCCLGQRVLRPASGFAFDVALELQAFNATFTDVPAAGAPRIVALGWWRPQFAITGAAAGGGLTASDIEDSHCGIGRAPGGTNGTAISAEFKRTIASSSGGPADPDGGAKWDTVPAPDPATALGWARLRCEDDELTYWVAESQGSPGAGTIPTASDYTLIYTADCSAMGRFGYIGPRLYTNTNGVGGRFYRMLNVIG
jgi:hypothetical protein